MIAYPYGSPISPCPSPVGKKEMNFAQQSTARIMSDIRNHEVTDSEALVYCSYLDKLFVDNSYLKQHNYIPVCSEAYGPEAQVKELIRKLSDGVIIAYLMHKIDSSGLDPESFHIALSRTNSKWGKGSFSSRNKREMKEESSVMSTGRNRFQLMTNLNTLLTKLSSPPYKILTNLHQFSAEKILSGSDYEILDLLWRLIKAISLKNISLDNYPELIRLSDENTTISELAASSEEILLLKWLNYHLTRAGSMRKVLNYSKDLSDSVAMVLLMSELAPDLCDPDLLNGVVELEIDDENTSEQEIERLMLKRASLMIQNAKLVGCDLKITAQDIVEGNARLGLIMVAELFKLFVGIPSLALNGEAVFNSHEYKQVAESLESASQELELLRQEIKDQEETYFSELARVESDLRKKAVHKELQLSCEIEKLKAVVSEKNEIFSKVEEVRDVFNNFRNSVKDQLNKTMDLLLSYVSQRDKIFKNANNYSISAFNNEGKKVVFQIPAPSLKQKCSFEFNLSSKKILMQNGEASLEVMTRQSSISMTTPKPQYNLEEPTFVLPSPEPKKKEVCTETTKADVTEVDDLLQIAKIIGRPLSCPPDIQLDSRRGNSLKEFAGKLSLNANTISKVAPELNIRSASLIPSVKRSKGTSTNDDVQETIADLPRLASIEARESIQVTQDIHNLVQSLMQENMRQIQQIQLLAAKVDEMTWLNQVMGDKVKEFSEEMIHRTRSPTVKKLL